MVDTFRFNFPGLTSPGYNHYTIAPSDSEDLAIKPRAIYAASDGNAVLRDHAGVDVTYPVVSGAILPFRPVRVLATGTTATLIAWY